MKRFVDVRHAEIGDSRFAWWDTVLDKFETHSGSMAWDSWHDFERDYKGDELDRYKALFPWPPEYLHVAEDDATLLRVALGALRSSYGAEPFPPPALCTTCKRYMSAFDQDSEKQRLARKGRISLLIDKLEARLSKTDRT